MSRLDQHVDALRTKLIFGKFIDAAARAALIFAAVVWLFILLDKLFALRLPHASIWFWLGSITATITAFIFAILKRPTRHETALAIDAKLGLKEKFSTALSIRTSTDPFAQAAVLDAETTAQNVSLHRRFPLQFPKAGFSAIVVILGVFLTAQFLSPLDLMGREEKHRRQMVQQQKVEEARKAVENALVQVNSVPKALAGNEALQKAKKDLEALLNQPIKDPVQAQRSVQKAMQEADAIRERIKDTQAVAAAQNQAKLFSSMQNMSSNEKGPVADAQRAIAQGDFGQAMEQIKQAIDQFDKMDDKAKTDAARQMAQMAKQLENLANDPKMQQQVQNQLQQMGANPQQAQQIMQQMQQAAAGNPQAQQRLNNMMQNLMRQANNGAPANAQQQQKMNQMMQQMQAAMNAQQNAQQMAGAAQQMAQAMQQGCNKPGQGQGQCQQQAAAAKQAMQQQLAQMQAMQQAAQQQAAANQGNNQGQGNNPGQGQWANQPVPGGPNQGQAMGDRSAKESAPYGVKQEASPAQTIEEGKIIASWFVKADSLKGESKEQLKQILTAQQKEASDDVDQERVPMQSQKVVRDYFDSMQKDAR